MSLELDDEIENTKKVLNLIHSCYESRGTTLEAVRKLKKSIDANLSTFDALSHKGEMRFFTQPKFNTRAKIAPQTRFYSTKVTRKRRKKGNVIFANPTQEERSQWSGHNDGVLKCLRH